MTSPAGAERQTRSEKQQIPPFWQPAQQARSAAVAELFDALEGLLIAYQALPDDERAQRWSGDADRITGEVARHLCTARTRLARSYPQPDAGPAT
jgi:hypothetical protein